MYFKDLILSTFLLLLTIGNGPMLQGQPVVKHGPPVPVNFCISSDEKELFRMINEYRAINNLPPIPLSKSLSHVAALHVRDLFFHHPDQGACNFHSWSDKGFWTPFCYPKDETKKISVWDKPRELTKYPSRGFEIVYWENNPLVRDTIIMVWKTEEYFNSFLLNTGKWQGKTWNAIGIAVYENYACAWFGEVPDPEGEPYVCGNKPVKPVQDTVKPVVKPAPKPAVKPKKPKSVKTTGMKADSLAGKPADTLAVRSGDSTTNPQKNVPLPKDSLSGTYCIIIKTNLSRTAADQLVLTLQSGGYPQAMAMEKEGKFRVSVFESADKPTVMAKLKEVKKRNKDAWLLKK